MPSEFNKGLAFGVTGGVALALTLLVFLDRAHWLGGDTGTADVSAPKAKHKKEEGKKKLKLKLSSRAQDPSSFEFPPIATLRSCFRECRGTPRQGLFVRSSLACFAAAAMLSLSL